MSERIDFEPLTGERSSGREDRVVRAVLGRIAHRASPAAGLSVAILAASRFALPVAIIAAAITAVAASASSGGPSGISAARALGVSYAMEQLIRQPEPPSIAEMLNAFGGGR